MSNLNKCQFIGRIGKEPETKQVSQDFKVVNFTLAVSEKWTDKSGEKKENTEWINCQASNKVAEIVEKYVQKGDLLYIEGKFKTRSWDKEGVKQYATFIQVEAVQMFPKSSGTQQSSNTSGSGLLPPTEHATQGMNEQPDDAGNDLPF